MENNIKVLFAAITITIAAFTGCSDGNNWQTDANNGHRPGNSNTEVEDNGDVFTIIPRPNKA